MSTFSSAGHHVKETCFSFLPRSSLVDLHGNLEGQPVEKELGRT